MPRPRSDKTKMCAACGAGAERVTAKFCQVCGQNLCEDYAPLAALRASYNLKPEQPRKIQTVAVAPKPEMKNLFTENKNNASSTAMAFAVYSLVPYIGILFCPGALVMGGIGLAVSYRQPQLGGRQTAGYSVLLGFIIAAIQILLWWLLYIIPELQR